MGRTNGSARSQIYKLALEELTDNNIEEIVKKFSISKEVLSNKKNKIYEEEKKRVMNKELNIY